MFWGCLLSYKVGGRRDQRALMGDIGRCCGGEGGNKNLCNNKCGGLPSAWIDFQGVTTAILWAQVISQFLSTIVILNGHWINGYKARTTCIVVRITLHTCTIVSKHLSLPSFHSEKPILHHTSVEVNLCENIGHTRCLLIWKSLHALLFVQRDLSVLLRMWCLK